MSIWVNRGGRERLPSFSKRRVNVNKSPLKSPTTVLSPESSDEFSSRHSSEEQSTDFRSPTTMGKYKTAGFEQVDSQTWFVSTDRPSDLLVEVDNISFHLHKRPILSRSGLLNRLAAQSSDTEKAYINLEDVPGGAEAFALAAKFCYGIVVELSPTNVAAVRCASEYLEMHEYLEEENVITKAEAYLSLVVFSSWQESIIVLQSCELLLPWAEDMQIVKRCIESVAYKACTDPRGVRWLYSGSENTPNTSAASRNPLESAHVKIAPNDWWYEDVSHLTFFCFSKVVAAIKQRGMKSDLLGGALEHYVQKWLPGLVKAPAETSLIKGDSSAGSPTKKISSPVHEASSPRRDPAGLCVSKGPTGPDSPSRLHDFIAEQNRNRHILEEIVSMLPQPKDSVSCSFLLRMLRAANMLNCSSACKVDLETKAGQQLDQGTLTDLLIPSFSHTSEYLYDVDLVRRLLDHFLALDQGVTASPKNNTFEKKTWGVFEVPAVKKAAQSAPHARAKVAKLLDSYLAEVARDSKLPLAKFQSLAEALPEFSRVSDDALYIAIDTYLKIHPSLTEHERKKLCRVLDCQRLTLDACMHAAQNERLPLRVVVQVLFGEQLKLRNAINGISSSVLKEDHVTADAPHAREPTAAVPAHTAARIDALAAHQQALQEGTNQMEIKALQCELAAMRIKCKELEKDHTIMHEQVEKFSRPPRGHSSSWSSGWKKLSKLQIFHHNNHKGEIAASPSERRTSNPRRWRNSIS